MASNQLIRDSINNDLNINTNFNKLNGDDLDICELNQVAEIVNGVKLHGGHLENQDLLSFSVQEPRSSLYKYIDTGEINRLFNSCSGVVPNERDKIKLSCMLSSLIYTYKDEELLKDFFKGREYSLINPYGILPCFVVPVGGIVFVVFKGSNTYKDYITNSRVLQVDDNYDIPGWIHKGFYKRLFDNNKHLDVSKEILKYTVGGSNIVVTGHSLGAGIGSLFYSWFKERSSSICKLITFGSPRVGNYRYALSILNSTRIVNGEDVITQVPPTPLYYHIGKNLNIRCKQKGATTWWNCLPFIKKRYSIIDHSVNEYIRVLMEE
jgi:hypothetical protein